MLLEGCFTKIFFFFLFWHTFPQKILRKEMPQKKKKKKKKKSPNCAWLNASGSSKSIACTTQVALGYSPPSV